MGASPATPRAALDGIAFVYTLEYLGVVLAHQERSELSP